MADHQEAQREAQVEEEEQREERQEEQQAQQARARRGIKRAPRTARMSATITNQGLTKRKSLVLWRRVQVYMRATRALPASMGRSPKRGSAAWRPMPIQAILLKGCRHSLTSTRCSSNPPIPTPIWHPAKGPTVSPSTILRSFNG